MAEKNQTYLTLDLALRVGEVLLASGAGAADVTAQMRNVAEACGLRRATADVTFNGLSMSHQASVEEPALVQLRHVSERVTDYEHLTMVDQLVRDLVNGRIDLTEARSRMARIVSSGHARSRTAVMLSNGLMGIGVGLIFGGNPVVTLAAFVAAMAIHRISRYLARRRYPVFYRQVAGGLFATMLAVGVSALGVDVGPSRIVTASIVVLLTGVNFMGAIQDALTGFPVTASARIFEAILATAGIIAGVSGGLTIAQLLGVTLPRLNPGASVLSPLPLTILGGALSATGFALAGYAPRRSIPPIAAVAGLAAGVYAACYAHGVGQAWSSTMAALVIGVAAHPLSARVRVPGLLLVVSGSVPLLPGMSIYRGMSLLSEGRPGGLIALFGAAAIAVAIASGAILGEYVAQPLSREARRLETRLSGPRLVGPPVLRSRALRRLRHRREA